MKTALNIYIYNNIYMSVYATGVLPFSIYSSKNNPSMEVGALNSGKKRKSPFKTQEIINKKTDRIKIISRFKNLTSVPSSPMLNDNYVSCENYLDNIKEGFIYFYKFILKIKKEFKKEIELLFEKEKVRYIYRNTNTYSQLLETSRHPDLLRNKVDRFIYLLRLYTVIDITNKYELSLGKNEIQALLNNDIPIFYIGCDDGLIYDDKKNVVEKNMNSSLIHTLIKKIESLNLKDMENQLKIINMSFIGSGMTKGMKSTFFNGDNSKIDKKIIDRLMINSFIYKNEMAWQSLVGMGSGVYNIMPIDFSLYQGSSGIALILSKFKEQSTDNINKIIDYTLSNYEFSKSQKMGAFDGKFGILYSLSNIYNMNIRLRGKIIKIVAEELNDINSNNKLINLNDDIISGYAGILGVLITINDIFENDKEIKKVSRILADKVVCYIKQKEINSKDTGYAHGNAGIIVQLYRYINHFVIDDNNKNQIVDIISKLEKIEVINNNKYQVGENAKYYSWCNGAFGIILKNSYLNKEYTLPANIEKDLIKNGFGDDYSICHGDIGNLAILENISPFDLDKDMILKKSLNKLFSIKKNYDYDDWGLMTGELGILAYYSHKGSSDIKRILCLEKLSMNNENKI